MNRSFSQPILIVPKGVHPHPLLTQVIDSDAIQRIMNQLELWDRDIVVDYQHESMKQCGRALAAGWVKAGTARVADEGIVAAIEWTDEAVRLIKSKQYRFVSPVFESVNGRITGLLNLGLTNNPNLHGMTPLTNQLTIQESQMDLTSELKRLLGLDEAAQESDIVKALQELIKQKGTSAVSLNSILGGEKTALLGLTPEASDDQIIERIEQIGKQSASVRRSDISRAVNEAIESGKLKPSLKTWGENLASANPESFKTFLVNSSPFVPLGGIISQCERGERALTQSESNVCGLLNLSAKEYLNQKD